VQDPPGIRFGARGLRPARDGTPADRDVDDAQLANQVVDIHAESRGCYGSPRVHAELRLGRQVRVGRKRVSRLLRITGP
jgi:putative transposase